MTIEQLPVGKRSFGTRRYGSSIYWIETAPPRPQPRPLEPGQRYDVVIVGAGFTGLWTAYQLLSRDPAMSVAILDREEVGFGASGRNGGFAMTSLNRSLHHLVRDQGLEAAGAAHEAAVDAVKGLVAVVRDEGIDCELDYGGLLTVATNESQERRIHRDIDAAEALGLADIRLLSGAELRARVDSPTYRVGHEEEHCAVLHPAKLARGLADVVTRMGAQLFEGVAVESVDPEASKVSTSQGEVHADQVVLALSAWGAQWRPFAREMVPIYTYVILTEPIPDELWERVGWQGREGIEDKRVHLHFYRRLQDGRMLWGGRENVQTFAGVIAPRHDRNERVFRLLEATFRKTFPQLSAVKFSHGWGGAVDITPSYIPIFGSMADGRLHYGHGYCGHGVGPSYLGGQVLADLCQGADTERTRLCFVEPPRARWPHEPIRFVGGYLTRLETVWFDEAGESGRGRSDEPALLRLSAKLFAPRFHRPAAEQGRDTGG
jgi:glycine/D-amino acid oxidase-like deaminating enzyme